MYDAKEMREFLWVIKYPRNVERNKKKPRKRKGKVHLRAIPYIHPNQKNFRSPEKTHPQMFMRRAVASSAVDVVGYTG